MERAGGPAESVKKVEDEVVKDRRRFFKTLDVMTELMPGDGRTTEDAKAKPHNCMVAEVKLTQPLYVVRCDPQATPL